MIVTPLETHEIFRGEIFKRSLMENKNGFVIRILIIPIKATGIRILTRGRRKFAFNYIMKTNLRRAMEKLWEYRERGIGIFTETLKLLVAIFQ